MSALTIGLLSDAHIPHRLKHLPQAVFDALAGVDLILHAGDVDEPRALGPLRAIAPVHAVRGNIHIQDLSRGGAALPAVVELELARKRVVLVHGHSPGTLGLFFKGARILTQWMRLTDNSDLNRLAVRRLARTYPEADTVVFGHAHRAHVEWIGDTLLINPGAVCPSPGEWQTVARIKIGERKPEVEIIHLHKRR
jgi:putative phosphoesterase